MRQNGDTDKMVGEMLSYPDVVACILYAEIATEAVIEYLIRRMQVSKGWYAHITLLLKNAKWLAPFVRSAQRFVCSLVHRQSEMRNLGNSSGAAIALVRSDIIVSYVAGMNLHMFDETKTASCGLFGSSSSFSSRRLCVPRTSCAWLPF